MSRPAGTQYSSEERGIPLPVIDDVLPELGKANVFTKVDLQSGYWHGTLDEDSSNIITSVTPFGIHKNGREFPLA